MSYYIRAFQNYVNFNGRDTRKQYWMFVLFSIIISFVLDIVASIILGEAGSIVTLIYSLAVLLPSWGISVRRMHDIGKSGWWILINIIPLIGWIWFIILCCQPSQQGENQWGVECAE